TGRIAGTPPSVPTLQPKFSFGCPAGAGGSSPFEEAFPTVISGPLVTRHPPRAVAVGAQSPSLFPQRLGEALELLLSSGRREALRIHPWSRALPRHHDRKERTAHLVCDDFKGSHR